MIKYIYVDLGGVYLNRGFWIANEKFAQKFNIPKEKIIDVLIKKNYTNLFSGKLSEEEYWEQSIKELNIDTTAVEMRSILLDSYELNHELVDWIDTIRTTKKVGLISDQIIHWWNFFDTKFTISPHFDDIIISADVGVHKPDPKIYEIMIKQAHVKPSEILFIDDLQINLPATKNQGINTILYTDNTTLKQDLATYNIVL